MLNWGATIQYSMPYLKSAVVDLGLPDFINHLIPLVEANLQTPVANTLTSGTMTTGTINPGVIWVGNTFQFGIEALIPINRQSGSNVGVIAQLHFYPRRHRSARHRQADLRQRRPARKPLSKELTMRRSSLLGIIPLLLLLAAGEATAHALLDHAEPRVGNKVATAPHEVTLWFTQKLEPAFSSITVTNAAGERVDSGKTRVSGNQMSVSLRPGGSGNLSRDVACAFGGHAYDRRQLHLSGRPVGRANRWTGSAREVNGPLIAIRAIHFAATAVTAGSLMFPGGGGGACFAFGDSGSEAVADADRCVWHGSVSRSPWRPA